MNRPNLIAMQGVLLAGILLGPIAAQATEAEATIDNFSFSPAILTVAPGTRVTWTNRDDIPHTVTDRDRPTEIKSPPLDTGETYSRTFTSSGTFTYFCSLHPHMQGTVVVR
jgi:plastocyanin